MEKYQGKYRIPSNRLKNWDYSSPGYYFITICTRERIPYFGEIQNGDMRSFTLGKIAHHFWIEIPNHFQNAKIDNFVVMPNHVHGIVVIDLIVEPRDNVETQHAASLRQRGKPTGSLLKPGSIATIIRSYKSAVTRWARQNGYQDFAWQSRFYDHIIRDENSLNNIRAYIAGNPLKWEIDEYFVEI